MSVVETTFGRVRGFSHRGLLHFHGVPFAAPPVGDLRFRPPATHSGWKGVREAYDFAPAAAQTNPIQKESRLTSTSNEDCLYLNVVTPGTGGAPKPVMVFVHGGAFVSGSSRLDGSGMGDLEEVAPASPDDEGFEASVAAARFARNAQTIVVSIAYRLGVFGWLHLDHLDGEHCGTANLGLLDQIAAVDWVRDNIAAFGGDPDQITLAGQSAGAMSVASILGFPAVTEGLAGAVLMSGGAETIQSKERAIETADRFLEQLGINDFAGLTKTSTDELLRSQGVLWWKLARERDGILHQDSHLYFGPVVDGVVLTRPPIESLDESAGNLPILIGTNRDEFVLPIGQRTNSALGRAELVDIVATVPSLAGEAAPIVDHYIRDHGDPDAAWDALRSDWYYRFPAVRLAELRSAHGAPVFRYLLNRRGHGSGATHSAQLRPMFLNVGRADMHVRRFSADFHGAIVTFVRRQHPSHDNLPPWFPYQDDRATMVYDDLRVLVNDPELVLRRLFPPETFLPPVMPPRTRQETTTPKTPSKGTID